MPGSAAAPVRGPDWTDRGCCRPVRERCRPRRRRLCTLRCSGSGRMRVGRFGGARRFRSVLLRVVDGDLRELSGALVVAEHLDPADVPLALGEGCTRMPRSVPRSAFRARIPQVLHVESPPLGGSSDLGEKPAAGPDHSSKSAEHGSRRAALSDDTRLVARTRWNLSMEPISVVNTGSWHRGGVGDRRLPVQ